MNWLYDLIFILLFVGIIYSGWRQGLLSVILRMMGWVAALVFIVGYSGQWATNIYHSIVEPQAVKAVAAAIPADAIAAMNDGAAAMQSLQTALDSLGGIMGGQSISLTQSNTIIALFQQDAGSLAQIVTQTVLEPVLINVVRIVIAILILVVCLVVFRILAWLTRSRRRGGALNKTNRLLGGVLGLGEALLTVYLYVSVLSVLAEVINGPKLSLSVLHDTIFVQLFM